MKGKGDDISVSSEKGFTLIELAIVLVIIGIILGAVLKGQDLIVAARAKKVVNWEKQWETAQWTYLDRKGRFAGDNSRNGVIGDGESGASQSAVTEIGSANFINAPTETTTVGSITFYMRMGNNNESTKKNVIAICKITDCSTVFDNDELVYMEAIDTAIDGYADAGAGNVRGATALTVTNGIVTVITTESSGTTTWSTSHKALVYYFDRPR